MDRLRQRLLFDAAELIEDERLTFEYRDQLLVEVVKLGEQIDVMRRA
jgi:hypothetical protein